MREFAVGHVRDQYLVSYFLPDPHLEKIQRAGRALKDLGCTEFRQVSSYDAESDLMQMTVFGFVLE